MCIYTDEARVKTVPVVYQDENVLVAVKPAGVSCEPDRRGGKTFPQLLCEQLGLGTAEPLLCHRLDNPTEGLLLLARTPEAQQAAQDAFRRGEVHKEYECLVRGTPSPHLSLIHILFCAAAPSPSLVDTASTRGCLLYTSRCV